MPIHRDQDRPPSGAPPRPGHRAHNPYDLLGQADDLHARISGLQSALDHHERLATLGTIAGLIAHEFNNILTPVMSYAQMALARPDDRELAHKALTRAVEGTERAASIAAAILGFVRDDSRGTAEAGHVPRGTPEPPRCDVAQAVHDAVACLARDPSKDGLKLIVDIAPGLMAAAKAVAIQHVVLNLVLNARNAMLPAGGVLTIRGWAQETPPRAGPGEVMVGGRDEDGPCSTWNMGPWVVIEVADTGRGMDPARLARLFEPFYTGGVRDHRGCCGISNAESGGSDCCGQASDALFEGDRRRGTGLGMTVCRRLVADSGGVIVVGSEVGRGTCVRVGVRGVGSGT